MHDPMILTLDPGDRVVLECLPDGTLRAAIEVPAPDGSWRLVAHARTTRDADVLVQLRRPAA